jgi:TPP-dependent pyruvate/acetoin dehydrogenase alpha subunit
VRDKLLAAGVEREQLDAVAAEVESEVAAAVAFADADAEPPVDELAAGMYAQGSAGQFERMRPGSPFGEEALIFDAGLGR